MKNLMAVLLLTSFCFTVPAMAGAGHSHDANGRHNLAPITSEEAISKASHKVKKLADSGKIDATWSAVKAVSTEQKVYAKGPEWVVKFKNDKVDDKSKQTLYLFYTPDGHYIAANYTGK
jgi:hypothetical protein